MAITTTGFQSPATQRVGLVPSVYDKIILLGAHETPLLSMIGTTNITGISDSWITDTLAQPKKNAHLEISGFDETPKSTKQKSSNHVQIFKTEVAVSDSMQAVKTYGGSEMAHQVGKKAREHKLDIEHALFGLGRDSDAKKSVFKAPTLRDDSTTGEMAGLFYFAAKGASSFSAGRRGNVLAFDDSKDWSGEATELNENVLHEILQSIYDSGATPRDVFIGAELKQAINRIATRQIGNEKKANLYLSTLETDFGVINFHLHRFLSKQYGLGDTLIAGDFNYVKHSLLIPTTLKDIPTDKTAKHKRYYTESTLRVTNADALSIAVGLKA